MLGSQVRFRGDVKRSIAGKNEGSAGETVFAVAGATLFMGLGSLVQSFGYLAFWIGGDTGHDVGRLTFGELFEAGRSRFADGLDDFCELLV